MQALKESLEKSKPAKKSAVGLDREHRTAAAQKKKKTGS
jgi:hypothetical protein